MRDEVELLIDRADAECLRITRRIERDRTAIDENLAGIARARAAEHPHQRRLAGAVLAEQHVHFAALQVERHIVQRANAWELFRDASHFEQRRVGGRVRHAKQAVSLAYVALLARRAIC